MVHNLYRNVMKRKVSFIFKLLAILLILAQLALLIAFLMTPDVSGFRN